MRLRLSNVSATGAKGASVEKQTWSGPKYSMPVGNADDEPNEYDDSPYTITMKLIEEGRDHLLLRRPIALHCPVRLLHGMRDTAVPWMTSSRIAEKLLSEDVRIFLIKDGDHRLSRDQDIARLKLTIDELLEEIDPD